MTFRPRSLSPIRSPTVSPDSPKSSGSESSKTSKPRSLSPIRFRKRTVEPDSPNSSNTNNNNAIRVEAVENPEAIVILLGWFGANLRHVQKYTKAHKHATFILAVAKKRDVLTGNQKSLRKLALKVAKHTAQHLKENPGVPLITHCFSSGGAIVVDQLDQLIQESNTATNDDDNDIALLKDHLKLQIFDSGPVFPKASSIKGAVKEAIPHTVPKKIVLAGVTSADKLGLFDGGEASRGVQFWTRMKESQLANPPAQAYIYSLADEICDIDDLKELISYRQQVDPSSKIATLEFQTGGHCNLIREHESMYCEFVKGLVNNCQPIDDE